MDKKTTITHTLKTIQPWFEAVWEGTKKAELRYDDRDYKVGDYCMLREYNPLMNQYGDRWVMVRISHIVSYRDFDILPIKWIMFSFEEVGRSLTRKRDISS